jgi:hypothetical protein
MAGVSYQDHGPEAIVTRGLCFTTLGFCSLPVIKEGNFTSDTSVDSLQSIWKVSKIL